jgi:adenylate kinase
MNELKTAILIGPSGCGKGTQAKLLKEYLEQHDPKHEVCYLQSGEKFREFIEGDNYTQQKVRDIVTNGGLCPSFMAIWVWASMFIEQMKGDEHLIIDGFPRRPDESPIMHSAFEFYGRKNPTVISFEIDDEVIIERLVHGRKRADDTPQGVAERLRFFKKNVSLAIKLLEEHPYYTVAHINADQPPKDVHQDILKILELQ